MTTINHMTTLNNAFSSNPTKCGFTAIYSTKPSSAHIFRFYVLSSEYFTGY